MCLWTCNLWTFGRQDVDEEARSTSGLRLYAVCYFFGFAVIGFLFFFYCCCFLFFFPSCQTRDTHTHISSWTRLVLLQVTPCNLPSTCLCVCIRVCVCVYLWRVISVELISRRCVIPHYPSWCIQHSRLYACMYLCIMNCVKCIYTRCMSLYTHVLLDPWIFFCFVFVIPLKVKLKE